MTQSGVPTTLLKLDSAERQELTDAQLTWIQFRDKNCSSGVYRLRGGTGYGGFLSNCLKRMTKERITDLQRDLEERQRQTVSLS